VVDPETVRQLTALAGGELFVVVPDVTDVGVVLAS
jgi:hypothetical protein